MMKRSTKQELYRFTKVEYKIGIINTRYGDVL